MSRTALFASVILRAVSDASMTISRGANGDRKHAQRTAAAWLEDMTPDFRLVCSLAGFEAEAVRDAYRKGISRRLPATPRKPSKGSQTGRRVRDLTVSLGGGV